MGSIAGSLQTQFIHPTTKNAGVLARPQVRRCVKPAWKQEVIRLQSSLADPGMQCIPSCWGNFELHRPLRFVLHDDGACCHLVAMAYVPNLQRNKVTAPQLA